MISMPILKFPVNVALIEDDEDFADLVVKSIQIETGYKVVNFYPKVDFSAQNEKKLEAFLETISQGEQTSLNTYSSEINLSDLKKVENFCETYFPIVLSDYALDFTNGLEVLGTIHGSFIQKTLITNIAEDKVAIDAFNENKISQFIKKHDEHLYTKVIDSVRKSTDSFFSKISEKIVGSYLSKTTSLLKSIEFATFLKELFDKHHVEKYFALDLNGSFHVEDGDARAFVFYITDMETHMAILNERNIKIEQELAVFKFDNMRIEIPSGSEMKNLHPCKRVIFDDVEHVYSFVSLAS